MVATINRAVTDAKIKMRFIMCTFIHLIYVDVISCDIIQRFKGRDALRDPGIQGPVLGSLRLSLGP
jgi:hypothetical protein